MKHCYSLIAVVAVATMLGPIWAYSIQDTGAQQWLNFKNAYGKSYSSAEEESRRMAIFYGNVRKIQEHNDRYKQGLVTFSAAINEWTDFEHEEFVAMMNGFNRTGLKRAHQVHGTMFVVQSDASAPTTVDWRTEGAVTPIKNQQQCGSCWAFSSTGSLEGQHFLKTGKLVSLSEQNLVDCSGNFGNFGCGGGWMDYAFQYVKSNGGIDTEKSYPYEAVDDTCRYRAKNSGAQDIGFVDITAGSEADLQVAVATVGPISVGIDASHMSFQFYDGGVYYEPNCSTELLDHGVLVVGYGVDKGQKYWLVKNSWGTSWGEDGYFKLARDRNNHCGVATKASYPLV